MSRHHNFHIFSQISKIFPFAPQEFHRFPTLNTRQAHPGTHHFHDFPHDFSPQMFGHPNDRPPNTGQLTQKQTWLSRLLVIHQKASINHRVSRSYITSGIASQMAFSLWRATVKKSSLAEGWKGNAWGLFCSGFRHQI